MGAFIKGSGTVECKMGTVRWGKQTDIFMKVVGEMVKKKAWEYLNSPMVIIMQESGDLI